MTASHEHEPIETHSAEPRVGIGKTVVWFFLPLLAISWMLMFRQYIEKHAEFTYVLKTWSFLGLLGLVAYWTLVMALACVVISHWLLSNSSVAMLVDGPRSDRLLVHVFRYALLTVLFVGLAHVVTFCSTMFVRVLLR